MTPLADGRNWRLDSAFVYDTPDWKRIKVPAGFETDLASIPKLFWNILPPFGKYTQGAVVHDWLYRTQPMERAEADELLHAMMILCRVPWWQRWLIYHNVRWFGGVAWRSDARKQAIKGLR